MEDTDKKREWNIGISHEIDFWRKWLKGDTPDAEAYLKSRLGDHRWLPEGIRKVITVPEDKLVRVLEVGAGPMTVLGNTWDGVDLEVVATDPLGDEYAKILSEYKLEPAVKTQAVFGEELSTTFPADHFDFALAHNALDRMALG